MSFTSSQREAITCRDGSVLVSAGAGSGKTRVLTERLMEYIDPKLSDRPPEDLDRFLIITFTHAAAGELKARIAGAYGRILCQITHDFRINTHLIEQPVIREKTFRTHTNLSPRQVRQNAGLSA